MSDFDPEFLLNGRFPVSRWHLIAEVSSIDGGRFGSPGARRADYIAIGKRRDGEGYSIHGIEVKQSRGDMQVELKKPEKSKPFFELCNYWWMLCPPTLTDYARDNLPSAWGIATQGIDGCFKVVREAPLNADAEITPRFVYSILNAKLRNRYAETVRYEAQEAVRMVAENENLFYEAAQINSAIKEKMREIVLKWPV